MFQFIFSAEFLTAAVLFGAGGTYLGVHLGRRSKTANAYADKIREGWDREREELRQQIRQLQENMKSKP
jgi:hypothetical protein